MGLETKNMFGLLKLTNPLRGDGTSAYNMNDCCLIIFFCMLLLNQIRDVSWIARLSYIAVGGIVLTIGSIIAAAAMFHDVGDDADGSGNMNMLWPTYSETGNPQDKTMLGSSWSVLQ